MRHCLVTLVLVAASLMLLGAGCASYDSDMPWNAPQPWEGSPSIPGMSGPNY